jgi:hypothetical protein
MEIISYFFIFFSKFKTFLGILKFKNFEYLYIIIVYTIIAISIAIIVYIFGKIIIHIIKKGVHGKRVKPLMVNIIIYINNHKYKLLHIKKFFIISRFIISLSVKPKYIRPSIFKIINI